MVIKGSDLAVVDGSRGQHARDRDLAAGDIDVELIADPGFLEALGVFLGPTSQAVGRSATVWLAF
jgi:hypothetical protein